MLLSENNIKAELSYAYLHAVAARAGIGCEWGTRHEDGIGIDAKLRVKERFSEDSQLTNFTVDVQLKSTSAESAERDGKIPFSIPLKNYDELRSTECAAPQLLVVLYLPNEGHEWLMHTMERLVLQKCAYWLSLRAAPESTNETSQTVYVPRANTLTCDNLRSLMTTFSKREVIKYDAP